MLELPNHHERFGMVDCVRGVKLEVISLEEGGKESEHREKGHERNSVGADESRKGCGYVCEKDISKAALGSLKVALLELC